jgi:hypothetical protein
MNFPVHEKKPLTMMMVERTLVADERLVDGFSPRSSDRARYRERRRLASLGGAEPGGGGTRGVAGWQLLRFLNNARRFSPVEVSQTASHTHPAVHWAPDPAGTFIIRTADSRESLISQIA